MADPDATPLVPFVLGLDEGVLEQPDGRLDVRRVERAETQVATVSAPSSSEIATSIE
jgi:hypothetical protein